MQYYLNIQTLAPSVNNEYLPRVIDAQIDERLSSSGAILIEGPKWCGKTRTAMNKAKSAVYMDDPRRKAINIHDAEHNPDNLLEGPVPRLIDEWQIAPSLWGAVRFTVDARALPGQFILTGSNTVDSDSITHSGIGRIARITMRPMSLFESRDSDGSVPLRDLFEGKAVRGESYMSLERLAFLISRGGWPASLNFDDKNALWIARNYLDTLIGSDISLVDGVSKNPDRVRKMIYSLSRNICTTASTSTIVKDIFTDSGQASVKTVESYIVALERLFILDDVPAWSPQLRSRSRVRSSPKRNFVDPSIAAASMWLSPEGMIDDLKTMGFLFESLCIRDLRVYSDAMHGRVYHYRDNTDLEVDAIIELNDRRWGAVEVKLGGEDNVELGANNLIRLKNKINEDKENAPAFLMVLTSAGFAHRRKDGVYVVPIGCLRD